MAHTIEQFLDGTGGARAWDDFTSGPLADPALDALRLRCVALRDSTASGYCGPEGLAEMRRMVDALRNSADRAQPR